MHDLYVVGQPITLTAEFVRVSDGALANPTAIALTITHPDGTVENKTHADCQNPSTGQFTYDTTAVANGVLSHRWVASGNGVADDITEYVLTGAYDHDGPCDSWCLPSDVFSCAPASAISEASRDYNLADEVAQAASRILFQLCGRRHPGICVDTIRPCRRSRYADPLGWHSSWGACGCSSYSACGCSGISELRLGADYPVLGIQSVRIDGAVIDPSTYRVDDWGWLVRTDGDVWPSSQDLSADPATDADTFQVVYYYGGRAPDDARLAAKRYASELYTACAGAAGCSLPRRIQEVARRGESVLFADPQFFLDNNLTGIDAVDAWLTSERYGAAHPGTVVATPDFLSTGRRTA